MSSNRILDKNIIKQEFVKVSIIIASYNDGEVLRKTVESIVSQTFNNWEIVIVDAGNCGYKNSKKIKVLKCPPRGISDAFNTGVKVAESDYLYFIGAGDYLWNKDVLKQMMEEIDKNKDMLVCGRINRMSEDGKTVRYTSALNFRKWNLLYKMGLPHQALFTNKKFFEKYGLFDLKCKYSMDYELLLRAYKTWPKVVMKDVIVAGWMEGGIGKDNTDKVLEEYHKIRNKNKIASSWTLDMLYKLSKWRYGYFK